jgi:ammonia channel protein AmtB
LVKKTKMKIQNKYIFRIIISEFLYFQKGAWVWHD